MTNIKRTSQSFVAALLLGAISLVRPPIACAQDPNYWAGVTEEELSNQLPLGQVQVLGAHNAYNTKGAGPTQQNYDFSGLLALGIRALDLDLHTMWYVPFGYRVCHGSDADDGSIPPPGTPTGSQHHNCNGNESARRTLVPDVLPEIKAAILSHPNSLVYLDIEPYLYPNDEADACSSFATSSGDSSISRPGART
jgi:hypothetical protein